MDLCHQSIRMLEGTPLLPSRVVEMPVLPLLDTAAPTNPDFAGAYTSLSIHPAAPALGASSSHVGLDLIRIREQVTALAAQYNSRALQIRRGVSSAPHTATGANHVADHRERERRKGNLQSTHAWHRVDRVFFG